MSRRAGSPPRGLLAGAHGLYGLSRARDVGGGAGVRREGQACRAPHAGGDGGGVSRRREARAGGGDAAGGPRLQGRQGRRLHLLDARYRRRARLRDDAVRRHRRGRHQRADHRRQGDLPRRALHLPRRGAPAAARHLPLAAGGDAATGRRGDTAAGFRQGRDHQRSCHARRHSRFGTARRASADLAPGGHRADARSRRLPPDAVEGPHGRRRGGAAPHHLGRGGDGARRGRRERRHARRAARQARRALYPALHWPADAGRGRRQPARPAQFRGIPRPPAARDAGDFRRFQRALRLHRHQALSPVRRLPLRPHPRGAGRRDLLVHQRQLPAARHRFRRRHPGAAICRAVRAAGECQVRPAQAVAARAPGQRRAPARAPTRGR